jgi:hypothetical protein
MDHFFLPLILKGFQAGWARIFRIPQMSRIFAYDLAKTVAFIRRKEVTLLNKLYLISLIIGNVA